MQISVNRQTVNVPDFFVVGAARSGTTTLYYLLSQHPDIFLPDVKEPGFFAFAGKSPEYSDPSLQRYHWRLEDYLALYEQADPHQILGDFSTVYLYEYEPTISNLIDFYNEQSKNIKILIILRNPIERAYSHFSSLVRSGIEDLTFEKAIDPLTLKARRSIRWDFDYIEYGYYYKRVKAFMDSFPMTSVLLYDDLKQDSARFLNEVLTFLEVKSRVIPSQHTFMRANTSGIPKVYWRLLFGDDPVKRFLKKTLPKRIILKLKVARERISAGVTSKSSMSPQMRRKLAEIYKEDIESLQELIGRDLSGWVTD